MLFLAKILHTKTRYDFWFLAKLCPEIIDNILIVPEFISSCFERVIRRHNRVRQTVSKTRLSYFVCLIACKNVTIILANLYSQPDLPTGIFHWKIFFVVKFGAFQRLLAVKLSFGTKW